MNDTRVNSLSNRRMTPTTSSRTYTQSKITPQTQQQRRETTKYSSPNTTERTVVQTTRRETPTVQKPTYTDRTYTPSYDRIPVTTRPRFNNTPVNRNYIKDIDDKKVITPRTNQSTYTTPRNNSTTRSSAPVNYSSPRSSTPTYSTPRNSSSSYSTPNRSSSPSFSTSNRGSSTSSTSSGRTYSGSENRSTSGGRR